MGTNFVRRPGYARASWILLGCALAAQASACVEADSEATPSDEDDAAGDTSTDAGGRDIGTIGLIPTPTESTTGCLSDPDCVAGMWCLQGECVSECDNASPCADGGVCNQRGQCLPAGSDPTDTAPVLVPDADLRLVVDGDTRIVTVAPGQTEVVLRARLEGELPADGLPWRLERDDELPGATATRVGRLQGLEQEFVVDVGLANPDRVDAESVSVTIRTPVGDAEWILVPDVQVSGGYSGRIGQGGGRSTVPFRFDLHVTPPDARLEDAESVEVVLPIALDNDFSPMAPVGEPAALRVAAVRDTATGAWVARMNGAWELSDTQVLPLRDADEVERSIRLELQQGSEGAIVGRLIDRWTGLVDTRGADGLVTPETVVWVGDYEVSRVADSTLDEGSREFDRLEAAVPLPWPTPVPESCDSPESVEWCSGVTDLVAFLELEPLAQATCALSIAQAAAESDRLGQVLDSFADGGEASGSFADLIDDCSTGEGDCAPSPRLACARELVAVPISRTTNDGDSRAALVEVFADVSRRMLLPDRMRALARDTQLRREWITLDAWPSLVASAVQAASESRIRQWSDDVVGAHLASLRRSLDPAALVVLGQGVESVEGNDARGRLLVEMSQTWNAVLESSRVVWDRSSRTPGTPETRQQLVDDGHRLLRELHLVQAVLSTLNTRSGVGWLNAGMSDRMADARESLSLLATPWQQVVFARDAEVVVNTSLDPRDGETTVIAQRRAAAEQAVGSADAQVAEILAEMETRELSETQLRGRYDREILSMVQQLAEMCGLPAGCTASDVSDSECRPSVEAGLCGMTVDGGVAVELPPEDRSSLAGQALLRVVDAIVGLSEAESALESHAQRLDLQLEELEASAQEIEEWNLLRLEGIVVTSDFMREMGQRRQEGILSMASNLDEQIALREASFAERMALQEEEDALAVEQLEMDQRTFQERQATRRAMVVEAELNIAEWNTMRVEAAESTFQSQMDELRAREKARKKARRRNRIGRVLGEVLEFGKNLVTGNVVGIVSQVARVASGDLQSSPPNTGSADEMAVERQLAQSLDAAELQLAQDEAELQQRYLGEQLTDIIELAELDRARRGFEISQLRNEAVRSREWEQVQLAELAASGQIDQAQLQAELAQLQNDSQLAQMEQAADVAYRQELSAFRGRQVAFQQELTRAAEYEFRITRSELALEQAIEEYRLNVIRAQFLDRRLEELLAERENIESLLGSPAVFFQRSSELTRAEQAVTLARDTLMDWLVALEYYAVRPFPDLRAAIITSSSAGQLASIALALNEIERSCGGNWNRQRETLSLRDDLLGLGEHLTDPVTGSVLSPAQRLRAVLAAANIPVDRRVRYRDDGTIGEGLAAESLLAVGFAINLEDFANLQAVCNARMASFAIELVGDIGPGSPVVTLVYDGTSYVRSCQPDIERIVSDLGAETTAFGEISHFRSPGRAASPVAGVNALPGEQSRSVSFSGLPLASRYAVLIDRTLGDNATLNWDALEDIVISVEYGYQDLFPANVCD
jgi:hypothetical protein